MNNDFWVKFWGVRGSIACPGPETLKYGGNTSCLEIRCGDYNLIFDAGTGLRLLGDEVSETHSLNCDIFFTHTHFDHVCGFPFFRPAYKKGNRLKLHNGHLAASGLSIEGEIRTLMRQPLFPISVDIMAADLVFIDFNAGETLEISERIRLKTALLNHPNGATGYRVEFGGKAICYVTDTEHVPGKPDASILGLIEGADIFIYDSTYTDEEYPRFKGWGHSTWQEGARLAEQAGVKTFVAFHHDPEHTDAFMDGVARDLEAMRPGSVVAREGMVLRP